MGSIGLVLIIIGSVIALIYGIKLIIIAFQESVLWGLLYLFLPLANLYFIITRWTECKDPFLKTLLAIPFFIIGGVITTSSQ